MPYLFESVKYYMAVVEVNHVSPILSYQKILPVTSVELPKSGSTLVTTQELHFSKMLSFALTFVPSYCAKHFCK